MAKRRLKKKPDVHKGIPVRISKDLATVLDKLARTHQTTRAWEVRAACLRYCEGNGIKLTDRKEFE